MYSLADLQQLLRNAGWPDLTVSTTAGQVPLIALMASIAQAESSGIPTAHNPSGEDSWGLWQINRRAHPFSVSQLTDPLTNAQLALGIYQSEGLRAWGVYTNGSYRTRGQLSQSIALYGGGPAAGPTGNFDDASSSSDLSLFQDYAPDTTSGIGTGGVVAVVVIAALAVLFIEW